MANRPALTLSQNGWDVENALNAFFSGEGMDWAVVAGHKFATSEGLQFGVTCILFKFNSSQTSLSFPFTHEKQSDGALHCKKVFFWNSFGFKMENLEKFWFVLLNDEVKNPTSFSGNRKYDDRLSGNSCLLFIVPFCMDSSSA